MSNSQGLNEAQNPNVPQSLTWASLRTRLQHASTSLRTLFLVVGYTVPMLILFTPGNIPVRFLEPIGINDENRWVVDIMILIACPALVWLAQVHDGPAIRQLVSATIRRSSSHEPFVAFTVEELSAVTSDFVGRGGFGVVYAAAHRTAHLVCVPPHIDPQPHVCLPPWQLRHARSPRVAAARGAVRDQVASQQHARRAQDAAR